MNQQDIVWVKFLFSNLTEHKVRPALVISNNVYNNANQDILICAITSSTKEDVYRLAIDNDNVSQGTLPLKSKIRTDKITLVEKKLLLQRLARLDDVTFDKAISLIQQLIQRCAQ